MKCDKCSLKYGPYCTDLRSYNAYEYKGDDCSAREFVRTEDANFYVCPQNRHMLTKPTGWYPGRGY